MFKFHNESGRSMVEMLGVLAIVGVLSIGGIAGYTAAMNTQRANDAVTHALRLATLASGKRLMSPTAVLEPSELAGTGFEFANDGTDGFTLTISNLSPAVIAKINKMKTDLAAATVSDDGNSVTFKFKNDLGSEEEVVEVGDVASDHRDASCTNGTYYDTGSYIAVCANNEWVMYQDEDGSSFYCTNGSDGKDHTTLDGMCSDRDYY